MNTNKTKNKPKKGTAKSTRAVKERTAGGVVFRIVNDEIEILMIQDRMGRWTIPKGHVEPGESLEETAYREIGEETALTDLKIWERLDKIHFFYRKEGKLISMTTQVFLVEALGDGEGIRPEDSEGIADVQWFPEKVALKLIEYKDTERLFRIGLEKVRQLAKTRMHSDMVN